MKLLVADRHTGKSTQAFAWVSHGTPTKRYPFWSRVLLVESLRMLEYHRRDYWARLEDFDHRVYDMLTWARARGVDPDVEVCIDDLQRVLGSQLLAMIPGRVTAATITAELWQPVEFVEKPTQIGYRL